MQNETLKMIPTVVRDKIPHQLSFVASAKTISLAWQDVPQFDSLHLWFSCNVSKAMHATTEPRLVLEVNYRAQGADHFSDLSSLDGPSWDVHVGVCLCEEAHEMRQWLHDDGLAKASLWLEQQTKLRGETTPLYWRATFDEDLREFHVTHSE